MKNIIIADDHSLIQDGFERIVLSHFPLSVVHKAKDKPTLLEVLKDHPADILFQDIKFGANDARDFIKTIKEQYPQLKIIIISTLADELTINTLLKQGVDGYISKTDDSSELLAAFEKLDKGEQYLSPEIKNTGIQKVTTTSVFLTERERQILSYIINGKTTKEIAALVFLSYKTIEIHRSNLFLKFDVKNVAALVKKAIFEGFI